MNKRLKELCKQAMGKDWRYDFDEEVAERFAELIVQECMSYMKDGDIDFMKFMIKERFGVEEQEKVVLKCSVCGTTEKVKYLGGYQAYLCDSVDCIPL